MSFTFTAAPRVVRQKNKYRQKKVKQLSDYTPWELERNYVKEQEEKIKIENMKRQLNNFKKQKRMRPYDIKPSPNPRIPVDLKFFLTDDFYVKKPEQRTENTQTDELMGLGRVTTRVVERDGPMGTIVEYEPEQLYIPKKTGVDVYCQVENDELFDFDREVQPILDILVTKTLEQSVLELEEEQEIQNMVEFKKQYVKRQCKKNDEDWEQIIEVEMDKIEDKDKKLSDLKFIQLKQHNLGMKVKSHRIACSYLRDLLPQTLTSLEQRGLYKDETIDKFKMDYTDYLVNEVLAVLQLEHDINKQTDNIFPEIEPELKSKRTPVDSKIARRRKKYNYVQDYQNGSERTFYIYQRKKEENCPLIFSCFLSMLWADSYKEYEVEMATKYEDLQQKLDAGHLNNDEFEDQITQDLPNPALEVYSCKVDNLKELLYTFSNDPQKKLLKHERTFSSGVCLYNEEGRIIEKVDYKNRAGKMASYKISEAYLAPNKFENEEDIIKLKVHKMAKHKAKYALIYNYAQNFDSKLNNVDDFKVAQYRLFDRKSGTNFFKAKFDKAMDGLFLINAAEGGDEEDQEKGRNCITACFLVYYDEGKGWGFDHIRSFGFGAETDDEFLTKAGSFLPSMHVRGDMKNLLAFWNKRLQEDNAVAVHTSESIAQLFGRKDPLKQQQEQTFNSKKKEGESDSGEEEDYEEEQGSEEHEGEEENTKREDPLAAQNGDPNQANLKELNTMPDNGNALIGPFTVNVDEEEYDQIIAKVDEYITESHPTLKAELPDGFELLKSGKSLLEDLTRLKEITDYRQVKLKRLVKEEEIEGDEEGDGEGQAENASQQDSEG